MSYPATCLLGHRLNAFRLNYVQPRLFLSIGGSATGGAQDVLIDSLAISDQLNETPNTLTATVRGTKPIEGAIVRVTVGSQNSNVPLFVGNILRVTRVWVADNPKFVLHHIEATDPTWRLTAVLVSARYRNLSASAIAADLLTRAPAGFTGAIDAGLPVLDEISFTNTTIIDAFVQLAQRIGGYAWCDYDSRVHLTAAVTTVSPPRALAAGHPSLADVSYVRDLTQIVTRAVVEGGGVNALAIALPGDTLLVVQDAAWYSPSGGYVRSGPQRITYTGLVRGGAGSLVGPGVTPGAAPTLARQTGAGIEVGAHGYAFTWVTASGETLPSPIAAIATVGVQAVLPPNGYQCSVSQADNYMNVSGSAPDYNATGNGPRIGDTVQYGLTFSLAPTPTDLTQETALGTISSLMTVRQVNPVGLPGGWTVACAPIVAVGGPTPPLAATYVHMWRQLNGGAWTFLSYRSTAGTNWVGNWVDTQGAIGGALPTPNAFIAAQQQVAVTGLALGPAAVTARKLYRTIAGGSALKLLTTIANNTATTYTDAAADATLGAAPPAADTSGLTGVTGQINPGATGILVSSPSPFNAGGGYALVGPQAIRYTGITGNTLTGIPALGPGSIGVAIAYNTPIVVPAQLTGIPAAGAGAIVYAIAAGDPVNVLVVVEDANAQATLAAFVGGDGVRESLLQDGRISLTEATARGRALLAQHKDVLETFAHRSRDPLTRSGATVTVDLPAPTDIHGTFRLQDVQIATFNARGLVMPTFNARSSSQRFTFEDLIRRLSETTPPPPTGEDR